MGRVPPNPVMARTDGEGQQWGHGGVGMRPTKNDLTGMRFGRLVAVSYCSPVKSEDGRRRRGKWRCVCDCGNVCCVDTSALIYGNTRSCGCYRRERLHEIHAKEAPVGTRYGHLTVIGYEGPYAIVRCDCGTEKRVRNKHLLNGSTKSCGCQQYIRASHKNS